MQNVKRDEIFAKFAKFVKCTKCGSRSERAYRCHSCKQLFCDNHIYGAYAAQPHSHLETVGHLQCKPCEEDELNKIGCCTVKQHTAGVRKYRLANVLHNPNVLTPISNI